MRRLLPLAALAVSAACQDVGGPAPERPRVPVLRAEDPRPMRVLFVGNSLTFFNDLPERVREMAVRDTTLRGPSVARVVRPGYSLRQHWALGEARDSIEHARWDYVVLQEGSVSIIANTDSTAWYVARFDSLARAHGARTVLFLAWTWGDLPPWAQDSVTRAYQVVAAQVDALIAPVGVAWALVRSVRPDLSLYLPDSIHPAPVGTYLAACVFAGTLWRRSPVGLAGTLAIGDTSVVPLDSPTVLQLASAAWATTMPYLPGGTPLDAPRAAIRADDGPRSQRPAGSVRRR